MIRVENLVKDYAGVPAVSGISFEVDAGEIVGFLGPNGAGKSTTMRILTGFLPPSSGEVEVAGFNLFEQPMEIRRNIGYMPENVPLYPEMRVREYLHYRAALKGVPGRQIKERTGSSMEKCGITEVSHKLIASLSKGYRQRVGLADALVHDPKLLILDEPTAGLDPNQIRAVRQLIKDLGKDRTVLLSTHILAEVEMVCSRAIIINRGEIEASDTIANLSMRVQSGSVLIEVKAEEKEAVEALGRIGHLSQCDVKAKHGEWVTIECLAKPGEDIRGDVDEMIKKRNWPLREFTRARATLEDVFVELTQE